MQNKYGFIYIWMDKKNKKFYIGSHYGTVDDGYICSSTWMLRAYKKRPKTFKRRILQLVDNRNMINEVEYEWLQLIKPEELKGKKYYNFYNHRFCHWSTDKRSRMSAKEKMSLAKKSMSEDARAIWKEKIRQASLGRTLSESARQKCRIARQNQVITPEHRAKIAKSNTGKIASNETREKISKAWLGRKHSIETKMKMSKSRRKRGPMSEETKSKLRLAALRQWGKN